MSRIAVVGSRSYKDLDRVRRVVKLLPSDSFIVSGGARGPDTVAWETALDRNLRCLVIKPQYARFGKIAPIVRNREIVDKSERVCAFWDGRSRGTAYTIAYAVFKGRPVTIHDEDGRTIHVSVTVQEPCG